MSEILTESFCERCGTRYTFEAARPKIRLKGVKTLSRGLKNFVLSDDTSMDEAMAAARSEADRETTAHQLDAFHKTFNFCLSCRQYTCPNCWNEVEARCQSCAPLGPARDRAGRIREPLGAVRRRRRRDRGQRNGHRPTGSICDHATSSVRGGHRPIEPDASRPSRRSQNRTEPPRPARCADGRARTLTPRTPSTDRPSRPAARRPACCSVSAWVRASTPSWPPSSESAPTPSRRPASRSRGRRRQRSADAPSVVERQTPRRRTRARADRGRRREPVRSPWPTRRSSRSKPRARSSAAEPSSREPVAEPEAVVEAPIERSAAPIEPSRPRSRGTA